MYALSFLIAPVTCHNAPTNGITALSWWDSLRGSMTSKAMPGRITLAEQVEGKRPDKEWFIAPQGSSQPRRNEKLAVTETRNKHAQMSKQSHAHIYMHKITGGIPLQIPKFSNSQIFFPNSSYMSQIVWTHLRKSCDLASTMSVSITSGWRGKPDSSEAIARMTVASRSLRNRKKVHWSIDYFSSNVTAEQKWVLI